MKQLVVVAVVAGVLSAFGVPPFGTMAPAAAAAQAGTQVPTGELALGSVRIGRKVLADGKPLAPGTYRVRLTAQEAQPDAAGASDELERWAEFIQGGQVKGREVVSIVPKDAVKAVANEAPPEPGTARVQVLKGNEYLRIWINRGGVQYLIHLPLAG